MANIKDISAQTGLSLATISRVFNNSPLVSPQTRQKVLDAADQLDYQPNFGAAALRSGKSRIIGVVIPEINNHFFAGIINGIEQKIKDSGYNIIIAQSHESAELETNILQSFFRLNVDGVLISTAKETNDYSFIQKLEEKQIPVVFFDRMPNLDMIDSVRIDNYSGAKIATQHLIDQGCQKIVHIAGDEQVSIFAERRKGYEDALIQNGLALNTDLITELQNNLDTNTKIISDLFQSHPDIDGFFAHGDFSGLYVLDILKSLDIPVPDKVKLIGFGNTDFTEHVTPSMSTIDQNCHEMGALTAEILMESLNSEHSAKTIRILEPKLIVRSSSSF